MSQSPLEAEPAPEEGEAAEEGLAAYRRGWAALNRWIRRGLSWSGDERNCAFLNLGDGTFADVSGSVGFDQADDARALALVDWDLDGDLDVVVTNRSTPRVRFLENRCTVRGLTLRPLGPDGSPAIGARVELWRAGDERPLVRGLRAGEGYLAQSSARLHFGLDGRAVERVVVRWPGADPETFAGVGEGTAFDLVRGTGRARPAGRGNPDARIPSAPPEGLPWNTADGVGRRVVLARPVPLPTLTIRSPAAEDDRGATLDLFGVQPGGAGTGTGRPILLHLWASWCPPCRGELQRFADAADAWNETGIAFLALAADEEPEPARAVLDELGWPWRWALAPQRTIDVLDALQAALLDRETRMPLPTSFLVDGAGALRVIYLGPVSPERVASDRRLLELPDADLREAAVPFPGTWRRAEIPDGVDLLEAKLRARDLEAEAVEVARARIEVRRTTRAEMLHTFARESAAQGRTEAAITTLRQALAEDPTLVGAHMDLGVLLHQGERLHEAIGAYLEVLALEPEHVDARFNLGLAYLGTFQWDSARAQAEALRDQDEELARTLEEAITRFRAEQDRARD